MSYQTKIETAAAPAIGTPVMRRSIYGDSAGWVVAVAEESGNVFSLSGGMQRQRHKITVVFEDLTFSENHESIVQPWLDAAARCDWLESIDQAEAAAKLTAAREKLAQQRARMQAESEAAAAALAAFRNKYRDKIPADAVAVIVADFEEDVSDVMTDYFDTRRTRRILLAFSKHNRDLFPEMRKAAKNHPETAHLADAPESGENRQKYSMGAGYFLTAGGAGRYSTGWKIRKERLYMAPGRNDRAEALPQGEWAIPEPSAATEDAPKPKRATGKAETGAQERAAPADGETVNGFTISEHMHTKKGFTFYIVQSPERVAREVFDRQMNQARALRGWYSRAWGGTPAGFAFKDQAAARKFAQESKNV